MSTKFSNFKELRERIVLPLDDMGYRLNARDVAAVKQDRVFNRPKVFVAASSGKLFRLVVNGTDKAFYREMPLDSEKIYFLRMSREAKARYEKLQLSKLSAPFQIASYSYNKADNSLPPLHLGQMHHLLAGLGRPYHWSMTEQAHKESREAPQIVNILFAGQTIIGAHGWDVSGLKTRSKSVFGTFFMLDQQARGRGLGAYLFDYTTLQKLERGAEHVPVTTSSECTDKRNVPAVEFYQKRGWRLTRTADFTYALFRKGEAKITPVTVPEEYFRDPSTGDVLPRFQDRFLQKKLAQISEELLPAASMPRSPPRMTANRTLRAVP